MDWIFYLVAAVLLVACSIGAFLYGTARQKKIYNEKVGSAEVKAREIMDEALRTAESTKREALLEVKEESLRSKNELDREIRERRNEISRTEKRIATRRKL